MVINQTVRAKDEVPVAELGEIHNKMETLLGKEDTYLAVIFYFPHHPRKGYECERPGYKINYDCCKPKYGMLL